MKKVLILSMLISFAMICSCQKQDSVVEQQLAQRKAELDAREKALDERMNALAEKEKAMANAQIIPTSPATQTSDPAQVKAERDRAIQQLSAEIRARIPDRSKITAGDPAKQERPAPRQLGPEDLQRQLQGNLDKAKMSGKAAFPAAEAGSPTPSPTP